MKNRELYYQPSGRISLKGLIQALLIGLPLAVLLGVFYSWCIWKIPFIYADVLLTVIFGGLLAAVTSAMIRIGKIRNVSFAVLLGFVMAATFIYAKWTEWSVIIGEEAAALPNSKFIATGIFPALLNPIETWELMRVSAKIGVWEIMDFEVKGILLWLVWIAEAAIFFYFQFLTALRQPRLPFSENNNLWMNGSICSKFLSATSSFEELCSQVETGDFSQLTLDRTGGIPYDRRWTVMCYEDLSTREHFLDIAENTGKTKKPVVPLFGGNKSLGFLRISKQKFEMLQEQIGGEWTPITINQKKSTERFTYKINQQP